MVGEPKEYAHKYYDQLDLMWLADATWPESTLIATSLEDMIKLFNEHIDSGVICDSEYGKIENYVGEHIMWHTIDNTPKEIFNKRYGGLKMYIDNSFHDRYLILDDTIYYHMGASINYFGANLYIKFEFYFYYFLFKFIFFNLILF